MKGTAIREALNDIQRGIEVGEHLADDGGDIVDVGLSALVSKAGDAHTRLTRMLDIRASMALDNLGKALACLSGEADVDDAGAEIRNVIGVIDGANPLGRTDDDQEAG